MSEIPKTVCELGQGLEGKAVYGMRDETISERKNQPPHFTHRIKPQGAQHFAIHIDEF